MYISTVVYYEDMPRMCMTQISNKLVYHIDLITRVHFPWVLNPTSSIPPPPQLCARNSKSRFKGIYKAIGFYPLMRFNNLKYKVSVL